MKKISIIGLGYVGLPLAIEFGKKFKTTGFDINTKRIEDLIMDTITQINLIKAQLKTHLIYGSQACL